MPQSEGRLPKSLFCPACLSIARSRPWPYTLLMCIPGLKDTQPSPVPGSSAPCVPARSPASHPSPSLPPALALPAQAPGPPGSGPHRPTRTGREQGSLLCRLHGSCRGARPLWNLPGSLALGVSLLSRVGGAGWVCVRRGRLLPRSGKAESTERSGHRGLRPEMAAGAGSAIFRGSRRRHLASHGQAAAGQPARDGFFCFGFVLF